jgi:hypothetical protein
LSIHGKHVVLVKYIFLDCFPIPCIHILDKNAGKKENKTACDFPWRSTIRILNENRELEQK